jgi:hypothetical protein
MKQYSFIRMFYRGKNRSCSGVPNYVSLLLTDYSMTSKFAISICKTQINSDTNTQTELHIQKLQLRTEGGGGFPKFRSFAKFEPNSQFRGIYIRNNVIRIWVSFICKLSGTPDYGATAPRSPFYLPSIN